MAAVFEPSAPSAKIFTPPMRSHSSPKPERNPAPSACSSRYTGTFLMTRSPSSPASRSICRAMKQSRPSKSWTPVSPTDQQYACARRMAAAISFGVGRGMWLETRSMASSKKMPVGRPAASRWICPPGGSAVCSSTRAIFIARLLTHAAWPLLCDR